MNWNEFKILLVDDERDILEFLSYNLKNEGFEIHTANNGADALRLAAEVKPHLVLLDVMMPEMDGIETCEEIRKIPELENTLVAFLTARGEDYSQIAGFEAGGDDYITKPIKPKLLISKIKSLLKRTTYSADRHGDEQRNQIVSGDLMIDKDRYLVIQNGKEIIFPRKEFELITLLISKPDKVFSREEIFDNIWGDNIVVGDRTIDVHIRKLREKLGDDCIKTVKGIGYKYVKP
ncbi:MAG: response regulator transcription factor [Bacteroidales bacterium]|nr:response regulator transcription factor [Bacteroidales bacterium]MDT8432178.1 response regulator transcription factor [Bacteroidales bacterium]